MITTNDFRNGMTIELDGTLYNILYFQHVKPGKGGAFVRSRLKNLKTGAVIEKTFRAGEKVELAVLDISLPEMQSSSRQAQQQTQERKLAVLNLLAIRENGIELKSPTFTFGLIPRQRDGYDYNLLKSCLAQVKQKFPDAVDVVIAPEDNIRYQVVIDIMDRCREAGFPNVSISG